MKWLVVALAAVAAVVVVNVALLSYGGSAKDPVGQLTPIGSVPAQPATTTVHTTTVTQTTTGDNGGGGKGRNHPEDD